MDQINFMDFYKEYLIFCKREKLYASEYKNIICHLAYLGFDLTERLLHSIISDITANYSPDILAILKKDALNSCSVHQLVQLSKVKPAERGSNQIVNSHKDNSLRSVLPTFSWK
ncbi:hypothetical protein OTU49_007624 [Cherax quadricarinatus]|uniref:Uncharacterized protein n=1 Tax=Cherax quadricarinatus TaxID=27406 RepID=A0AAW0YLP6_CHEQU